MHAICSLLDLQRTAVAFLKTEVLPWHRPEGVHHGIKPGSRRNDFWGSCDSLVLEAGVRPQDRVVRNLCLARCFALPHQICTEFPRPCRSVGGSRCQTDDVALVSHYPANLLFAQAQPPPPSLIRQVARTSHFRTCCRAQRLDTQHVFLCCHYFHGARTTRFGVVTRCSSTGGLSGSRLPRWSIVSPKHLQ